MKSLFFTPCVLLFLSFNKSPNFNSPVCASYADTDHIIHALDGLTTEWPDTTFQTDKETSIRYAVDNDAQHLFLALRIADFRTQMKLMRQGMNLFIDLKGKKKENRGVEFPLKSEPGEGTNNQREGNEQRGNFDKTAFRESMAVHLFAMKLFGFSDAEPTRQNLEMAGSANISFTWDSADIMHIEYIIPFNMLGDAVSLNKKMISIGWKINAVQFASGNNVGTSTSLQGRPSGGGPPSRNTGRGGPGNNSFSKADMEKMTQEQSFWTKYTISM